MMVFADEFAESIASTLQPVAGILELTIPEKMTRVSRHQSQRR